MKILIKNGIVMRNLNDKITFEKMDILIVGKYIAEISKNIEQEVDDLIDASNQLVMPGFINMHTHLPMKMLQGVAEGMNLEKWLTEIIWPLESSMTDKDVELATKMTILELLDCGTTCFNDMYEHQEGILKATKDMGVRGVICKTFFGSSMTDSDINDSLAFLENHKSNELIDVSIAVHQLCDISRDNMNKVLDAFRGKSKYLHIHLAESKFTYEKVKEQFNMTPAEAMVSFNTSGYNVLAAHCVQFSKEDVNLFKGKNIFPIHNPVSNAKLASGISPVEDFISAGVPVSIATDGSASNNKLNMLEELKFGALMQKLRYNDPLAGNAEDYIKMLSINPSIALGKQDVLGTIDIGKLADIVTFPLDEFSVVPNLNMLNNLLYSGSGLKTSNVIINGKIIKRENAYIAFSEKAIVNNFNIMVSNFYKNQSIVKIGNYKD